MYKKNNKEYIIKHGIPLSNIINQKIENKFNANIISATQYNRLAQILKIVKNDRLGKMDIDKITTENIQNFLNNNTHYSNSTISKIYDQLKQAFKSASQNKYIIENPLDYALKPKSDKEKYKNAFLLELYIGIRIGEVLALSPNDIDLENNILKVNKTLTLDKDGQVILGKRTKTYAGKRDLPIPNFLHNIINEQIDISKINKCDLLFSNNNKFVHTPTVNSQFKRILKNLKIYENGLSTHSLRHTYGTRCIESGMPAVVLQKLMGHADIKVTLNTYTKIFSNFKKDEINKVNSYYEKNHFLESEEEK